MGPKRQATVPPGATPAAQRTRRTSRSPQAPVAAPETPVTAPVSPTDGGGLIVATRFGLPPQIELAQNDHIAGADNAETSTTENAAVRHTITQYTHTSI